MALNGAPSKWGRLVAGKEKNHQSLLVMKGNTADLELVISLLDRTGARPLTNIMPFSDDGLQEAFRQLKSRRNRGKIVFGIVASSQLVVVAIFKRLKDCYRHCRIKPFILNMHCNLSSEGMVTLSIVIY